MQLFVIAALVAVAAAARLEHLERSYLPPDNSIGVARSPFGSSGGHGSFGGNSGTLGAHSGSFAAHSGSFGAHSGSFGAAGQPGRSAGGNFAGATSNQYLPPDHGPSASASGSQFGGSLHGLGGQQNFRSQQYGGHQAGQQHGASQFGSPNSGSFGAPSFQQQPQQSAAASRQYLAPKTGSYQQPPQQAFDEQTGYHY